MSNIDSLEIVPIFGEIGHLKGYLNGLNLRLSNTEFPVELDDIKHLQRSVLRIDKYLSEIMGSDEEDIDPEDKGVSTVAIKK